MLTAPMAMMVYCLSTQSPVTPSDGLPSPAVERDHAGAVQAPDEGVISLLKNGKVRFELLDEQGARHKASLVKIDGDRLVLRSRNNVVTVPADQLQRSDRRGDSPWDGAAIGLSVGLGLWALVAQSDRGLGLDTKADNPDDFTLTDTVSLLCF